MNQFQQCVHLLPHTFQCLRHKQMFFFLLRLCPVGQHFVVKYRTLISLRSETHNGTADTHMIL